MKLNDRSNGTIALCPGFHAPELTEQFLEHLTVVYPSGWNILVIETQHYSPYSSPDILRYLYEQLNGKNSDVWLKTPIIFIAFSAGVVGAMGAAFALETLGGQVSALFALDGWGVPAVGHFPTHRISHDHFTHWSSALLGAGQDSFYAAPSVDHLELWRSPHTISGNWVSQSQPAKKITVLQFLNHWLQTYTTGISG